ncbi:MAG TPA: acetyl-CoA carboxylase biotin carboxyl carrier protein subunit [Candidatus Limnocylindrales bacterium]|nr:acetyl-CoA carboxylase biotin carboxyl carrier protein subunit [Candidatus Limnocylindrales bacterium]
MTAIRVVPAPGTGLPEDEPETIVVGASDAAFRVEPWGPGRAVVHGEPGSDCWAWIGADHPATTTRLRTIEVVVDGWRFELAVEDAARADLRRRATRDRDASNASGPLEIRAIIPGRVAAVRVAVGDAVEAGAGLLVVEAMKMQNELRAARAGTIEHVAVAAGDTIELGDLLVVLG